MPLQLKPGQTAQLAVLPAVVARQKCENWAWAAALEAVLRVQGVRLDQTYWVTRLNGGELCLPRAGAPDDLIRALESQRHVLDDGRTMRLHVRYTAGAPRSVDDLIMSLRQNRPLILFWRGHACLLSAMTYDEFIGPNGARIFEVRDLSLVDAYYKPGERGRTGTFVKGANDLAELDGMMQVQVVWQ